MAQMGPLKIATTKIPPQKIKQYQREQDGWRRRQRARRRVIPPARGRRHRNRQPSPSLWQPDRPEPTMEISIGFQPDIVFMWQVDDRNIGGTEPQALWVVE